MHGFPDNLALSKLSSDDTRNVLHGVGVTEETGWVGLDLSDLKAISLVKTSGGVDDADDEGTLHAALAVAGDLGVVADGKRVGESESGWAGSTLDGLVDMCCGKSR